MAEQIQFTEEEVAKISKLRSDVAEVFTQLGQITIEKERRIKEIDDIKNQLLEKHQNLQVEEQEIFQSLNQKYGDGNYDPSTNIFTPSPKENKDE